MARLLAKDVEIVHSHLPSLYRLQSLDEFATTVIQIIPQIVQSDVTGYTEVNPSFKRVLGALSTPEAEAIYLEHKPSFEEFMHTHPLVQHFLQAKEGQAKKVSDFLTLKKWKNTEVYQEFYRYFGLTRQMVMTLPIKKPAVLGIALNRERHDFTENDRCLLNYVLPHVTQAYENAVAYTEITQQVSSMGQALEALNAGVVELDHAGQIIRLSELANDALTSFFPNLMNSGNRMPADIDDWLSEQIQVLVEDSSFAEKTMPYIIRQEHGRLTLRVMKAQQSDGYIVTTERYLASVSYKTLQHAFGLTGREAEILFWVAQGKSNPEIAIVLGISPRTVQKHLESIFEKLMVETRVQAAIKAIHELTNV